MRQLQEEKQRIKNKQSLLENKIREDYAGLSNSLKPMNMVKQALGSFSSKDSTSTNESNSVKKMFGYGLASLAVSWLLKKAGSKASNIFSRK